MNEGRRAFLAASALWGGAVAIGGSGSARSMQAGADADLELERLLEDLSVFGPVLRSGNANHAPMAIESMSRLGLLGESRAWFQGYADELAPAPKAKGTFERESWRGGLGGREHLGDWIAVMEADVAALGWRRALNFWCQRLAPGLAGAAGHGLIRAGHAARSLRQRDSAIRRTELAHALAYWASTYTTLPGDPLGGGSLSISQALTEIPRLPVGDRTRRGNLTQRMRPLTEFAPFGVAVAKVDLTNAEAALDALLLGGARLYREHSQGSLIVFVHVLTIAGAVRRLWPDVEGEARRLLVAYAWRAVAGFYSAYAEDCDPMAQAEEAQMTRDSLIEAARRSGEAHAFKLVDLALSEAVVQEERLFLAVAADAVQRYSG